MREPQSRPGDDEQPEVGADFSAGDELAGRLRAVQQILAAIDPDSEAGRRLTIRYMSICTALKMPGASADRCMQRLEILMTEAESALRAAGKEV